MKNVSRYVKSRSDKQLQSRASENDTSNCDPEDVTANNSAIVPCGLIAWSLFNDTYGFSVNNTKLGVSKKNIAWKSDQEHKFGSDVYPKNFQRGGLIGGPKLNSTIPVNIPLFSSELVACFQFIFLTLISRLYFTVLSDTVTVLHDACNS